MDLLWTFRGNLKSIVTIRKITALGGSMLCGFILVMLPQIFCWFQLNGVPFPPRHMKFAGEGLSGISLFNLFEKIWALFFSAKWGLLFSMPLALAGGVGLFLKSDWLKEFRPGLVAYLVGIFGIVIIYPEDSASYGHRHLISALPIFAIGLGNLLRHISEARFKWGAMVANGMENFSYWWIGSFPGLAIFSISIAANFLGDGVRDYLDPRLRKSF